jgi:hypothetical protein
MMVMSSREMGMGTGVELKEDPGQSKEPGLGLVKGDRQISLNGPSKSNSRHTECPGPSLCIDDGVLFLSRRSSPARSLRSRQSEKGNRTLLKAAL